MDKSNTSCAEEGSSHGPGFMKKDELFIPANISDTNYHPQEDPLPVEIIENAAFYHAMKWSGDHAARRGVTYQSSPSPFSSKHALCCRCLCEGANAAAFERILLDDPSFEAARSNVCIYDPLFQSRRVVRNVPRTSDYAIVLRAVYNTPSIFVSRREMVTSCVGAYYLTPAQQASVGLQVSQQASGEAAACHVLVQAASDCGHLVPDTTPGCVRAAAHRYLLVVTDDPASVREVAIDTSKWAPAERAQWGAAAAGQRVATACNLIMAMAVDPKGSLPAVIVNAFHDKQTDRLAMMRDMAIQMGPQVPMVGSGGSARSGRHRIFPHMPINE